MHFQARRDRLETHAKGVMHDRVKETLDLPDDTDLRVIAVGYLGDPISLPDNLRERETPSMRKRYLKSYLRENTQKECSFG